MGCFISILLMWAINHNWSTWVLQSLRARTCDLCSVLMNSSTQMTFKFILPAQTRLLQLIPIYSTSSYSFVTEYSMNFRYKSWKLSSLFISPSHWPIKCSHLPFSWWVLSTSSGLPLAQMELLWELTLSRDHSF